MVWGDTYSTLELCRPAPAAPVLLQQVLHVPDWDFNTTCRTFKGCLREIKAWSGGVLAAGGRGLVRLAAPSPGQRDGGGWQGHTIFWGKELLVKRGG